MNNNEENKKPDNNLSDRALKGNRLEISQEILINKYSLHDLNPEYEDSEIQTMYNVSQVSIDLIRLLKKSFGDTDIIKICETVKALIERY